MNIILMLGSQTLPGYSNITIEVWDRAGNYKSDIFSIVVNATPVNPGNSGIPATP